MSAKLIKVNVNPDDVTKVDFVFSRPHLDPLTITLKEKADWPVILNQPLEKVEAWFIKEYSDLEWLLKMGGVL